jgi:hypothetical protein
LSFARTQQMPVKHDVRTVCSLSSSCASSYLK